jgi:hypothetical protein
METKFISTNKKIALMVALQRGEKEAIQTIINELGRLESVIKDYEIGILALSEMAYNGSRLCDGGEIEAEKLNLLLMFNQGTNVCFSTKAPLLQNRCYVPFFFGI